MQQLQKIDVLRGVAIVLVFGFHSMLEVFGDFIIHSYQGFWYDSSKVTNKNLILNLNPFALGNVGVELFLIISGFLIHLGYLKGGSKFVGTKFYNKRFWRIYPPYLIALTLFSLTVGTGGNFNLITHLTLTHNFFSKTLFAINPSFWSLALEAQLYLLYPVYLLLHNKLGLKKSVVVIASIAAVFTGFEIFTGIADSYSIFKLWIVWVLGAYLGECFFYNQRIFTGSAIYLIAGYILFILLKTTIVFAYCWPIAFSLFCICFIDWYLHTEIKIPFSNLISKILALIGLYSYSIYLFHQPFLKNIIGFFSKNFASNALTLIGCVLSFILILVLSFITYHLLEIPSIKFGTKFFARFSRKIDE